MARKKTKQTKEVTKTLVVFSEGEKTEPNYLNGYKADYASDPRAIIIKNSKNTDPKGIVNEAAKYKSDNKLSKDDQVWAIFDRESVSKYSDQYHKEVSQLAQSKGILIAFSNVCFEQWLLYHFTCSAKHYSSYDNLITESELRTKLAEISISSYEKGQNIYSKLKDYIDTAITNAIRIREQLELSCPGMHPAEKGGYVDIDLLLKAIKEINKN
ncbi:RloB family protein [Acinetobacter baumannii]|uniref:RloB family protein n=1 Tax=Acinetobacter baumannii TaxID=470 RepID=UPI00233F7B12|nr:RloB family protein [Acinetobacter baumannii]MDC5265023.1 RloB family protein [Acinetobacter baumannii]